MAEKLPWNAASYDTVSTVQQEWGRRILARIGLRGNEAVVDAGCGTARLAELLAAAVPQGWVLAVDSSKEMLEVARSRLGEETNIRLLRADLSALPLAGAVDMIFSNAVFHWIPDHESLFGSLAGALRPGGRLVAQCGGHGNLARTYAVSRAVAASPRFAAFLRSFREPFLFATAEDTERSLRLAGFIEIEVSLTPAPTPFPTRQAFRDFVATVIVRPYLEALPSEERRGFVEAFVDACPSYHLDYVRLNLSARRI